MYHVVVVVRVYRFGHCRLSSHPRWGLLYRFFNNLVAKQVAPWALRRQVLTVRQRCDEAI
jgi:hypothetical protein